jgi:signal transduction histidine kinase
MSGLAEERISPELQITLFRIIQETTMNIARHSRATHVFIDIKTDRERFAMTIKDDGIGFDPSAAMENLQTGRGLGVQGMRERATQINGELQICSTPDGGTTVECSVPLKMEA